MSQKKRNHVTSGDLLLYSNVFQTRHNEECHYYSLMHRQVGGGEKGVEVLFLEQLNPRLSETTRHLYLLFPQTQACYVFRLRKPFVKGQVLSAQGHKTQKHDSLSYFT